MGKGKRIRGQRTKIEKDDSAKLLLTKRGITTESYYQLTIIGLLFLAVSAIVWVLFDANIIYYEPYFYADFFDCIAAPLLAFTLVESFFYSENKRKNILKLFITAIICEPFKDIVTFEGNVWFKQNIFFSLLISYLMLCFIHTEWINNLTSKLYKKQTVQKIISLFLKISLVLFSITIPSFLNFEYGFRFICLVLLFDFARHRKHIKVFQALSVMLFIISYKEWYYMNIACLLALLIIFRAEKSKLKTSNFHSDKPVKIISLLIYPLGLIIASVIKLIIR